MHSRFHHRVIMITIMIVFARDPVFHSTFCRNLLTRARKRDEENTQASDKCRSNYMLMAESCTHYLLFESLHAVPRFVYIYISDKL